MYKVNLNFKEYIKLIIVCIKLICTGYSSIFIFKLLLNCLKIEIDVVSYNKVLVYIKKNMI